MLIKLSYINSLWLFIDCDELRVLRGLHNYYNCIMIIGSFYSTIHSMVYSIKYTIGWYIKYTICWCITYTICWYTLHLTSALTIVEFLHNSPLALTNLFGSLPSSV